MSKKKDIESAVRSEKSALTMAIKQIVKGKASQRKLALAVALCGAVLFSGCKTTPSVEVIEFCARAAGQATALVLNKCDISEEQREALADTFTILGAVVPKAGQSVSETWLPVAEAHLAELVAKGKISETTRKGALAVFKVALVGVAALEKRYPALAKSRDLALAAAGGFVTGFLASFDTCPDCHDCTVQAGFADRDVREAVMSAALRAGLVPVAGDGALSVPTSK